MAPVTPRTSYPRPRQRADQRPAPTPSERLLADLNPPQREAVTHGEGPLLVLAGAGSGKTRVLTHRIAWLLATGPARARARSSRSRSPTRPPNEMRERVASLVGGVSRAMWVMTFHSACARILRADAPRLGYKRAFTIYDEADSLRMVKRCMERARARPEALRAARRQVGDLGGEERARRRRPTTATPPAPAFEEAVADVYRLYERRMVEASAMDFDDLLVRTVNLLELFADVREQVPPDLPLGAGRRVPGHQPRAVPDAPAARPRSTAT